MGKRGFKGEKTHLQKSGLLVAQNFFLISCLKSLRVSRYYSVSRKLQPEGSERK